MTAARLLLLFLLVYGYNRARVVLMRNISAGPVRMRVDDGTVDDETTDRKWIRKFNCSSDGPFGSGNP